MIAVVSGASRGIGRSMAFALAKEGFDLALGARNLGQLEKLREELLILYPSVKTLVYSVDFGIKEEIYAFARAVSDFGEVGVIINNVGIFKAGKLSMESDSDFERHMAVNLYSAWYLTRTLVKGMIERQNGHIFNVCSTASLQPRREAASYSISKMAMYAFHKVLCEEMRDFNIKVSAIMPGSVNTSSWDGSGAPVKNFVQADDIAKAAVFALNNSEHAFTEEIILKPLDRDL